MSEMGILGFAVALLFALRMVHAAGRGLLYAASPSERRLSIACFAAFLAILLHSFVDQNMYRNANALTVMWIAGIATARGPR